MPCGLAGLAGVVPAFADTGQTISATIAGAAGPPQTVSIAALKAIPCPTYAGSAPARYGVAGKLPAESLPVDSWTLRTVLSCGMGLGIGGITGVAVYQSDGRRETGAGSQLLPPDVSASATDFDDPAEMPLVAYDGTNIVYYRPWRGGSDTNAGDEVTERAPSPLRLLVSTGPRLDVLAAASSDTVTAGASVRFSATATDHGSGAAPTSQLSYDWDFDGAAADSHAAAPTVTFAAAGRYSVAVTVTDAGGGDGYDPITITVDAAAGTPTTPSSPNAPPTGPQQSSGAVTGGSPGKPTPARVKTPPASHAAPTPSSATTKHATTTPAKPKPAAAVTRPAVPTTPTAATPAGAPATHPPAATLAGGRVITGRLLGTVTALPADASPLVSVVPADAVATAPAVRRSSGGSSVLPGIGGGLAVVLLLGLGAGYQLRGRPNPVARLALG